MSQQPQPVDTKSIVEYANSMLVYDSVTCTARIHFTNVTQLYITTRAVDSLEPAGIASCNDDPDSLKALSNDATSKMPTCSLTLKGVWRRYENLVINLSRSYELYAHGDPVVLIGAELLPQPFEWDVDTLCMPESSTLMLRVPHHKMKDCATFALASRVYVILEHLIGIVYVRDGLSSRYVHEKTLRF
ncbi:MAG TPA: hypothetical protein PLW14_11450 [Chlorobiota bacterium]|nr:hypothetical protein [Chlorobiota bacterium]